jgi:exonuclease SbcC
MRPLSLRLKGITRFADPLDLDLTSAPEGLIALVGGNGAGKTTLLDCLGPAPLFRALSTRAGSLKDHCTARDAVVELEVAFAGRRYRHRVQVDPDFSAGRGKEEAFLFEDGVPLCAGRVTDYDELIERIYPPKAVFFASAFAAQNRKGNFLELDMRGRKDLFASLLGLSHLQTLAERAGAARRPLDAIAGRLDEASAALLRQQEEHVRLAIELEEAASLVSRLELEGRGLEAKADAARAALATARALLGALDGARAAALRQRSAFTTQAEGAEREASEAHATILRLELTEERIPTLRIDADRLIAATARHAELQTAHREQAAIVSGIAEAAGAIDREIAGLRSRITDSDRAARMLATDREALAAIRSRIDAAGDLRSIAKGIDDRILAIDGDVTRSRTRIATEEREASAAQLRAEGALREAERQAGLLAGVPCKGARVLHEEGLFAPTVNLPAGQQAPLTDCGTCRFLGDARAAAEQLPALRAAVEAATARTEAVKAERATLTSQEQALAALRTEQEAARRKVSALDRDEAQAVTLGGAIRAGEEAADKLAGLQVDLQAAEGRRAQVGGLDEARAKLSTIEADGYRARDAKVALLGADTRLRAAEDEVGALPLHRATREAASLRAREARASAAEVAVPDDPATAREQEAQASREASTAAHDLATAQSGLQGARDAASRLRGRLEQLGDLPAKRATLEARRQRVALRRSGFVLLEQGLGREGIQALEIDASGPEVSTIANQLLLAAFGGRFTLQLRTLQEAKGARVQKEVFDIVVFDGQSGGSRAHAQLSGGEQVLIDEAMKLALAIFGARRSGVQMETLFRDEADGALSEEMASRYPDMLRRAVTLGGFRNVYFVTHRQTCAEQADARIIVADGRATLD